MDENKSLNEIDNQETNIPQQLPEDTQPAQDDAEIIQPEAQNTEDEVQEDAVHEDSTYPPKKEGGEYDDRGYYVFPDGSFYDLLGEYHSVSGDEADDSTQAFTWEPIDHSDLLVPPMDKKKRHSAFKVTLIIMACVFATAFLILAGVLIYSMFDTHADANNNRPTVNITVSDKGPTSLNDGFASAELLEQVNQSIVVITTESSKAAGLGSGFIISPDGYIVTNQHVIDGAKEVWVNLYDGSSYRAKVVGESARDDIAVLKISAKDLPAITLGKSSNCYVGEFVYAIGCPDSYDYSWTVTMGIISHTNRNVKIYYDNGTLEKTMNLIQTDVSVNPGNSGGPIINTRGEVVGIVTLKITNTEGMGFAIPIDGAIEIVEALIEKGDASDVDSSISAPRPMIGITCVGVSANKYYKTNSTGIEEVEKDYADKNPNSCFYASVGGIYVMSIDERYNAVGVLQEGDIIVSMGGTAIHTNNQLSYCLNDYKPGDEIELDVYRDGEYVTVKLTLAKEIKD